MSAFALTEQERALLQGAVEKVKLAESLRGKCINVGTARDSETWAHVEAAELHAFDVLCDVVGIVILGRLADETAKTHAMLLEARRAAL